MSERKAQCKAKNIPLRVGCICAIVFPLFWVILWLAGSTRQSSLFNFILHLPVYPVELLFNVLAVPKGMAGMAWALPAIIMTIISAVAIGFITGYGITYAIVKLRNVDSDTSNEIEKNPEGEVKEK